MTSSPSHPAPQVATPAQWTAEKPPTDGRRIYVMSFRLVKFTPYKPDGQRQMKRKGRWQQAGEYAGWENCDEPHGPWITAGDTIPDALTLAEAAPAMRDALQAMVDLFEPEGDIRVLNEPERSALAAARSALALARGAAPAGGEGSK